MKDNNNNLLFGIIIGICAILLLSLFGFGGMMGNYGMMGGYGAGAMFFGWIMWILIIALIVAGIYWLIKTANRK